MEALRIREDGNGSHLDVAQVAVSLGSLTVEMAIFDAARAFFDLALRNYTLDESADAHPRAAHALAGLARVRRHQGSKMLQQRDSLSARRAGLLVLDEAINFQARPCAVERPWASATACTRLRSRSCEPWKVKGTRWNGP